MILYQDNPNLDLKTVTTIRKTIEYRRNCKFIAEKYYVIDVDCFFVEGKWCRTDSGAILFDSETQKWIHKKYIDSLIKGVVGFEKGIPTIGYFTENVYNNVHCRSRETGSITAINSRILEENGYFEDPAVAIWYRLKEFSEKDIVYRKTIRNEKSHNDKGYNIEDNDAEMKEKIKNYATYPLIISNEAKDMAVFLGKYTFGAEIEIAQGNVPSHILHRHGFVICRDGSLDGGPELVSIPLGGAKGLQNLVNFSEEVKERGTINIHCAFHLHFGNIPLDDKFLSAFYVLSRKIQYE